MRYREYRLISIFFVVSLMLGLFVLDGRLVWGASSVKVSVEPQSVTVVEGQAFTVNVTVTNVTDLAGWQFEVVWSKTILDCVNSTINRIFSPDWVIRNEIDNDYDATHGRYFGAYSFWPPSPSFNGDATLVTLSFDTKGIGTTTLNLYDTSLANSSAQPIDGWDNKDSPDDGSVTVLPVVSVGGTTTSIESPDLPYWIISILSIMSLVAASSMWRKRELCKESVN